jgi:hypothetical protein
MDYKKLHKFRKITAIKTLFWKMRPALVRSPLCCGLWQSVCERNRLHLPMLPARCLSDFATESVLLPGTKDLEHGQDAPLADLVFLLQLIRKLKPKSILEVGTYRAKTTFAFAQNASDAKIVSYDIARIESPYRDFLESNSLHELRIDNFSKNTQVHSEPAFDFIFIDAGHRFDEVLSDSRICFQIVSEKGCIVWHDYRTNEFLNPGLEVPEALDVLQRERPIYAVPGTTCALWSGNSSLLPML